MKIIFTLLFTFTLISTALASVRVEAHNDHSHEEVTVSEHTYDSHEHTTQNNKDSDTSGDCAHFHIHCTSLCLGVLLTNKFSHNPMSYESKVTSFNLHTLSSQEFVNSLYRPPIA